MTNQTQSQNSSPTAEKILAGIAKGIWKNDGYEGEPPPITPDDLKPHEPVQIAHDRAGGLKLDTIREMPIPLVRQMFEVEGPIYRTPEIDQALNGVSKEFENLDATVAAIEENHSSLWKKYNTLFSASAFFTFGVFLIEDLAERIEAIHQMWIKVKEAKVDIPYPLEKVVRQWLIEQTHRTMKSATIDHANQLTTTPFVISDVNRRKWERVGRIDTVEVDGELIITQIRQIPGAVHDAKKGGLNVYKPKGTQGEFLPMETKRSNMEIPIPLVAYQEFGDNLRSAIAPDVAQLLTIACAANDPLILTIEEGASLLARSEDGGLRKIQSSDKQRFINAFACIYGGMPIWVKNKDFTDFVPLTACDRFSDGRISIAPASWLRDRGAGQWTLTAGFGRAGQSRLKGDAHNNNVWRVVGGVEYWLARAQFKSKGTHRNISQALIPANGTTGPGNWQTLTWQGLMMIAGDVWDWNDRTAYKRAHKRFEKVKSALIQHGYEIKKLNRPAEAGDTVEFLFGKRKDGKVQVRATARFVEGARKARGNNWQTASLSEFLGF